MEATARLLLNEATMLKDELSGGSDSSLNQSQIDHIIKKRRIKARS